MEISMPVVQLDAQKFASDTPAIKASVPSPDQSQKEPTPEGPIITISSSPSYSKEELAEHVARKGNAMGLWIREMESKTNTLFQALDELELQVASGMPEINDYDWDISIDANDQLIVTGDTLNNEQKNLIQRMAEELGISSKAAAYRDTLVEIVELDRGVKMKSNDIGKYDLSKENFHEIVGLHSLKVDTPRGNAPIYKPSYNFVAIAQSVHTYLEAHAEAKYSPKSPSLSEHA